MTNDQHPSPAANVLGVDPTENPEYTDSQSEDNSPCRTGKPSQQLPVTGQSSGFASYETGKPIGTEALAGEQLISQACVSATSTPKPIQEKVGCTLTSTSEFQSLPTGCQPSSTSPAQNVQGDDSLISKPSTQRIAKFGKAEYAAYDDARRSNEPSSPETNVVLRAALKPFATDADIYDDQGIDDGEKSFKDNITVGDLRRARAALAASEGSTE